MSEAFGWFDGVEVHWEGEREREKEKEKKKRKRKKKKKTQENIIPRENRLGCPRESPPVSRGHPLRATRGWSIYVSNLFLPPPLTPPGHEEWRRRHFCEGCCVLYCQREKKTRKKKNKQVPVVHTAPSLLILKMQKLHGDDHLAPPELMAGRGTSRKGWRHFCEHLGKLLERKKKDYKKIKNSPKKCHKNEVHTPVRITIQ